MGCFLFFFFGSDEDELKSTLVRVVHMYERTENCWFAYTLNG